MPEYVVTITITYQRRHADRAGAEAFAEEEADALVGELQEWGTREWQVEEVREDR